MALARVAIYDAIDGQPLDDILEARVDVDPEAVPALVQQRIAVSTAPPS